MLWQWLFFLPLAYLVGPVLGYGLLGVWVINGFYRVGQSISCGTQWAGRKWANIRI
jgi:Na+-driven multidrug efflux pump